MAVVDWNRYYGPPDICIGKQNVTPKPQHRPEIVQLIESHAIPVEPFTACGRTEYTLPRSVDIVGRDV